MRLLVQQRRVQVAPRPPLALRDVLEPRGDEHEGRLAVREGADHAGAAADLAVEALDRVVGADPPPVSGREARVGQGLGAALADRLRGLPEPRRLQLDATASALASEAPRDPVAWIALSIAATLGRFDLGALESALR